MKIVSGFPPNIDKIEAVFPNIRTSPVSFAYGDTIYSPDGRAVAKHLQVHEEVHEKQQAAYPGGKDAWWDEYLANPLFRVEQEVPAYAAQVAYIGRMFGQEKGRMALETYSKALSGPIYGNSISYFMAKTRIMRGMKGDYE